MRMTLSHITADGLTALVDWPCQAMPGHILRLEEATYVQVLSVDAVKGDLSKQQLSLKLLSGKPTMAHRSAQVLSREDLLREAVAHQERLFPQAATSTLGELPVSMDALGGLTILSTPDAHSLLAGGPAVLSALSHIAQPMVIDTCGQFRGLEGFQHLTLGGHGRPAGRASRFSIDLLGIEFLLATIPTFFPPSLREDVLRSLAALLPSESGFLSLKQVLDPARLSGLMSQLPSAGRSPLIRLLQEGHALGLFAQTPADVLLPNQLSTPTVIDLSAIKPSWKPWCLEALLQTCYQTLHRRSSALKPVLLTVIHPEYLASPVQKWSYLFESQQVPLAWVLNDRANLIGLKPLATTYMALASDRSLKVWGQLTHQLPVLTYLPHVALSEVPEPEVPDAETFDQVPALLPDPAVVPDLILAEAPDKRAFLDVEEIPSPLEDEIPSEIDLQEALNLHASERHDDDWLPEPEVLNGPSLAITLEALSVEASSEPTLLPLIPSPQVETLPEQAPEQETEEDYTPVMVSLPGSVYEEARAYVNASEPSILLPHGSRLDEGLQALPQAIPEAAPPSVPIALANMPELTELTELPELPELPELKEAPPLQADVPPAPSPVHAGWLEFDLPLPPGDDPLTGDRLPSDPLSRPHSLPEGSPIAPLPIEPSYATSTPSAFEPDWNAPPQPVDLNAIQPGPEGPLSIWDRPEDLLLQASSQPGTWLQDSAGVSASASEGLPEPLPETAASDLLANLGLPVSLDPLLDVPNLNVSGLDLPALDLNPPLVSPSETISPILPVAQEVATQEAPVMVPDFVQGQRVNHPQYGQGVVQTIIDMGNRTILNIQFDTAGKRLLDPSLSQLEKLS